MLQSHLRRFLLALIFLTTVACGRTPLDPEVTATTCGNGLLESREECDDGNSSDGDGCDSFCRVESATCGNGAVEFPEECDDGNRIWGDGCDPSCRREGICGNAILEIGEECDDGNRIDGDGCDSSCFSEFPSECGNGILEVPEECDDGNRSDGDGCDATCRIEGACGNAILEIGEECDDGNFVPGDGCDAFCRLEAPPTCGNFRVDPGEECDDGNLLPGDGCDERCRLEGPAFCGDGRLDFGEECDDGNRFAGDGCDPFCRIETPPSCGNSIVDPGEECDDGNRFPGDGCDERCRLEAPPFCGNGMLEPGEECDDGNRFPGDGCNERCQLERMPFCGNAVVEIGEECDDGNLRPGDGCDEFCRRETPVRCGNGALDPGEECDDGNLAPGDGCDERCRLEPVCGNGVLEVGEECDDGNLVPGDGCDPVCRVEVMPICGDGTVDPGEECDDGNLRPGDGCDPLCRVERCTPDLVLGALPANVTVTRSIDLAAESDDHAGCGTGSDVVLSFELPIDGELQLEVLQLGDHRYGLYRDAGGFTCTDSLVRCYDPGAVPSGLTTFPMMGAGRYLLVVEEDALGAGGPANVALTLLATTPGCGNGALDAGEVCDDGNTRSGDGCSADCLSDETCGNGSVDVAIGEQCDDGNTASGDGCSATCLAEVCGNGSIDAGEVCDDGNRRDGDGCSRNCASDESCGNTIVDGAVGEECDDGNTVSGDGCDGTCRLEIGMCTIDEDLGALRLGIPVTRTLNVGTASDMWSTDCSTAGPERVLTFNLPRPGNVTVRMSQTGHHNIGIYREGEVTDRCVARMGLCGSTGPGGPLGIRFLRRPAGRYFAIVEANGAASAGIANLSILWEGCAPADDLGALAVGSTTRRMFDTTTGTSRNRAACAGAMSGQEHVIAFTLSRETTLDLSWVQTGDHVFGLFTEDGGNCDASPVACHDPIGAAMGATSFPRLPAGRYVLIVDAHDPGDEGRVDLSLDAR